MRQVFKNRSVLQNREFTFFLGTRVFLTIALQIQAVVAGWHIFRLTNDPLSLGLIGLAEAIPAISVALYAGHIADKGNKRNILLYAAGGMFFCSLLLALVTWPHMQELAGKQNVLYGMYAGILLSGIARGFYAPTAFAFLSQLVKREDLARATTLSSSSWQMAAIAGPALGGFLYAGMGITGSFGFVLLFTCLALFCLGSITAVTVQQPHQQDPLGKRLAEGIRFVFRHKVILSALSLDLFAVLFGGAVALLPVFADEILLAGPQGLGMLRAAPSLGASITMIWISLRGPAQKPGVLLLWCVAGFGACIIGFGLSQSFWLSMFLLFCSGAFDSVSVVIRGNILQLQTPDHMRGRVSAVNSIFIGSSNEIGAFESGIAARLMGTVPSVVFGGCMTLLIVAFTSLRSKELRRFTYK